MKLHLQSLFGLHVYMRYSLAETTPAPRIWVHKRGSYCHWSAKIDDISV
jgi:hypothetical protein